MHLMAGVDVLWYSSVACNFFHSILPLICPYLRFQLTILCNGKRETECCFVIKTG